MRDNHITFKQAKERVDVGDTVYMVCDDAVVETTVRAIERYYLRTTHGLLWYRDHREEWFLTELFARLAAKERSAT